MISWAVCHIAESYSCIMSCVTYCSCVMNHDWAMLCCAVLCCAAWDIDLIRVSGASRLTNFDYRNGNPVEMRYTGDKSSILSIKSHLCCKLCTLAWTCKVNSLDRQCCITPVALWG